MINCDLCGLPLGHSKIGRTIGEKIFRFCCLGCQQVFLILSASPDGMPANFRETDLYRVCMEAGIIPKAPENESPLASAGATQDSSLTPLKLTLKVEGMWCPTCSWLIEEVLRRTKGISEVKAFFLSDMAKVRYLPQELSPEEILSKISDLGYSPSLFQDGPKESKEKKMWERNMFAPAVFPSLPSPHLLFPHVLFQES